jgi:hypothetical protein
MVSGLRLCGGPSDRRGVPPSDAHRGRGRLATAVVSENAATGATIPAPRDAIAGEAARRRRNKGRGSSPSRPRETRPVRREARERGRVVTADLDTFEPLAERLRRSDGDTEPQAAHSFRSRGECASAQALPSRKGKYDQADREVPSSVSAERQCPASRVQPRWEASCRRAPGTGNTVRGSTVRARLGARPRAPARDRAQPGDPLADRGRMSAVPAATVLRRRLGSHPRPGLRGPDRLVPRQPSSRRSRSGRGRARGWRARSSLRARRRRGSRTGYGHGESLPLSPIVKSVSGRIVGTGGVTRGWRRGAVPARRRRRASGRRYTNSIFLQSRRFHRGRGHSCAGRMTPKNSETGRS